MHVQRPNYTGTNIYDTLNRFKALFNGTDMSSFTDECRSVLRFWLYLNKVNKLPEFDSDAESNQRSRFGEESAFWGKIIIADSGD